MSTGPRAGGGSAAARKKAPRRVHAEPTKAAPPGENRALARDATARTAARSSTGSGHSPDWLAGPEAGSLTRQPKAGQVGGGPPLTRPARECQAGRLVRVTAIQARQVFRACPAGPTGPAPLTRPRDFPLRL